MDAPAEVTFAYLLLGGIGLLLLAGGGLVLFLVTYQKRLLQQQLRLRGADALHQQEYRPEQQHYQQPLQRESAQLALVTGEPAGGKQCGITFQQRWHDQARREETLKQ